MTSQPSKQKWLDRRCIDVATRRRIDVAFWFYMEVGATSFKRRWIDVVTATSNRRRKIVVYGSRNNVFLATSIQHWIDVAKQRSPK